MQRGEIRTARSQHRDESWYQGTADAIFQNINLIEQAEPDIVAIFGADHIYRMNIAHMIAFHEKAGAACTVAALPVHKRRAHEFGVIETGADNRILGFHEKNPQAPEFPDKADHVFASMGNYLFSTGALVKALHEDAGDPDSSRDFGRDILPRLVADRRAVCAYDYETNEIPGEPPGQPAYWRDVGTLDAYWEANMDLRAIKPALNLYNRQWPLRTSSYPDPPAKFTFDEENRRGEAIDSIISGGCILSGGLVRNSVLGSGVKVHAGALVEDSVILDNCDIGRRAMIRRAILDKNVHVAPDSTIGYDEEQDRRLYHVTETGLVVVEGNHSPVSISTVFV
ncbi:MAG: sugar phosphate nucleotidyltransferase [Bryobacteraceae bacterium]|jgi:glucose-1-phosphate adenylyltransferase